MVYTCKVLEKLGKTQTHLDFKMIMKQVDIDYNGKVSLIEFLCLHFNVEWQSVVRATVEQGDGGNVDNINIIINISICIIISVVFNGIFNIGIIPSNF